MLRYVTDLANIGNMLRKQVAYVCNIYVKLLYITYLANIGNMLRKHVADVWHF